MLNDAADYFAALRASLLRAQRQVHIIGWDIHSETPLVGACGAAEDGLPPTLAPFLQALLDRQPGLTINILVWNFAALYAAEREPNSAEKFTRGSKGRIRFCLDSSLPIGSAQHQKFVVIDNALAFAGGLDLTIRRWDTSAHLPDHPLRRDPEGRPYAPFHDVQCMVDGEAAAALGRLAARRWSAAGCAAETADRRSIDIWPDSVPVGAHDIPVGIARTELPHASGPAIREVKRLFERSIAAATRCIYIENQFTSAEELAAMLAARMAAAPALQVLIVAPQTHSSWIEAQAMQGSRGAFLHAFAAAGVSARVRLVYPATAGAPVMVHSKLMIIDDAFLRIGSANLNNRSMGADSECDLAFVAETEDHCRFIRGLRHRLIAHFCDVDERQVASHDDRLLPFLDAHAASAAPKALRPIALEPHAPSAINGLIQPIADPKTPLNLEGTARRMWTPRTILASLSLVLAFVGLALAWRYTSLRDFASIDFLAELLDRSRFAPAIAILGFVVGGLLVFPVVVLIAATAAAFGPWTGALTATAGVLASASLLFLVGRYLGHEKLQSLLGPRAARVQRRLVGKGLIAIAIVRMMPVAPFSIVNVLAGASALKWRDFILGTLLGMMPGIAVMAALGAQIADFARNASWQTVIPIGLTIVAWIAVCLAVQFVVTWIAGRKA